MTFVAGCPVWYIEIMGHLCMREEAELPSCGAVPAFQPILAPGGAVGIPHYGGSYGTRSPP